MYFPRSFRSFNRSVYVMKQGPIMYYKERGWSSFSNPNCSVNNRTTSAWPDFSKFLCEINEPAFIKISVILYFDPHITKSASLIISQSICTFSVIATGETRNELFLSTFSSSSVRGPESLKVLKQNSSISILFWHINVYVEDQKSERDTSWV